MYINDKMLFILCQAGKVGTGIITGEQMTKRCQMWASSRKDIHLIQMSAQRHSARSRTEINDSCIMHHVRV